MLMLISFYFLRVSDNGLAMRETVRGKGVENGKNNTFAGFELYCPIFVNRYSIVQKSFLLDVCIKKLVEKHLSTLISMG